MNIWLWWWWLDYECVPYHRSCLNTDLVTVFSLHVCILPLFDKCTKVAHNFHCCDLVFRCCPLIRMFNYTRERERDGHGMMMMMIIYMVDAEKEQLYLQGVAYANLLDSIQHTFVIERSPRGGIDKIIKSYKCIEGINCDDCASKSFNRFECEFDGRGHELY